MMRVRLEYHIDDVTEDCYPEDFTDCETKEQLVDALVDIGDEQACYGVVPRDSDVDELWEAIQKLKEGK